MSDHDGSSPDSISLCDDLFRALSWDTLDIQFGYQTAGEEFTLEKAPQIYQEARTALLAARLMRQPLGGE